MKWQLECFSSVTWKLRGKFQKPPRDQIASIYGLENMHSMQSSYRYLSNVLYHPHSINKVAIVCVFSTLMMNWYIFVFLYFPDSPLSISLLVLYVLLGVLGGALVLCWCCWSPGWFVWRVSICRFLPCCNSVCASCQLCARSCANSKEHRLAKVTPHTPTNGASAGAAATTHSADENVNMSAV